MTTSPKYEMKMSLEVLKHLGFNLYSNVPAVISEVVANAYDADADKVTIEIQDNKIVITDDGLGMTLKDINDKFLLVGYQKRRDKDVTKDGKDGNRVSFKYERPVMGRKGIGKLSLFSIADNIEIHSSKNGEKNGFILNRHDIEKEISNSEKYHPTDVPQNKISISKGTRIVITQLKKNVNHTEAFLRKRLAKRFSVISDKFKVIINETPVGIEDRDFFKKLQFLWLIGNHTDNYSSKFPIEKTSSLSGDFNTRELLADGTFKEVKNSISGWIGTCNKPADLEEDTINNNKISIICRGKLWLEDILKTYNESGIYATYLIGEITADFLDIDDKEDIATSSRQSIKEDDPRYVGLSSHVFQLIKEIKKVWGSMRSEASRKVALANATLFNPALQEWFESLKTEKSREHALTLFATIDTFHFDKSDEQEKKKILYAQGIMAFEKLRLRENLDELKRMLTVDDFNLAGLFNDMNDIEAAMYYDIANERVQIIREFKEKLDVNEREKKIQAYLFEHLWLLNPSWERATAGSELMEQRVQSEFDSIVADLTPEEKASRFDIKYRAAGGKHIIIELKRFKPTYKVDVFGLAKQVNKYKTGLTKCLQAQGIMTPHIETIVVLGEILEDDPNLITSSMAAVGGRIIYYDRLLEESFMAYQTYLDREKESSRIKNITDRILKES